MGKDFSSKCIYSNFRFYRKWKLKKRLVFALFVLLFVLVLFIIYVSRVVNPIILDYGEAQINRLMVKSCNNAIMNMSTISYDDIYEINYDTSHNITSIVANAQTINNISNALAIETQRELDINTSLGISMPIGTLSGISFLSGKGRDISLAVNPLGNVTCSFYTTFVSAGINQTSHKIYVKITTSAFLILPFVSQRVTRDIDYLLCECLIVGRIPDTYLTLPQNIY